MTFGESESEKLFAYLASHLATTHLPCPEGGEGEVAYSSRVIAASLQGALSELGITGLTIGGSGAGPVRRVNFLGSVFIPDFTISYHNSQLIACEVKLARGPNPQGPIATAIGQAAVYKASGFPFAIALIVDFTAVSNYPEKEPSLPGSQRSGIRVILRRAGPDGLGAGIAAEV